MAAHAPFHTDQPVGEVDVVPEKCSKLAASQAGIERGAPQRAVLEAQGGDERGGLAGLFCLRRKLVHFRSGTYDSQPHPTGKANVPRENLIYTAEEATHAVDLGLEVLTVAYTSPRQKYPELVRWSQSNAHVPDWLVEVRRST